MSVNIIWSLTNGGESIVSTIDHGNSSNGDTTSGQEIFIRHDGDNEITSVGLYIRAFSGSYVGSFTAAADIAEILSWGDASTESSFGGFQCHLLATSNYPVGFWPTYDDKSPTTELSEYPQSFVYRTGVGDSSSNAVTIPTTTGASTAGEIQAGSSPNVRFKTRVQVPTDEDTVGIRQWEQVITYNYTS